MDLTADKLWGIVITAVGSLASGIIFLYNRITKGIDQVAEDLEEYKEQQARDTEHHRSKMSSEMGELKAKLEGVTTALSYINKNISDIQSSVGTIATILQERNRK